MCHLRLDQTMADCVVANVTNSEDRSACDALRERADRVRQSGDDAGGDVPEAMIQGTTPRETQIRMKTWVLAFQEYPWRLLRLCLSACCIFLFA